MGIDIGSPFNDLISSWVDQMPIKPVEAADAP